MFSIDRRRIHYFDWISFCIIGILSMISLLFVFSATYSPERPISIFFQKQLVGIASGFLIYFSMCAVNHRSLERWGYFLFFATMGLLIFTLFKGSVGLGAQRWINLGFIKFQPSELTKLFFPAFFTHSLAANFDGTMRLRTYGPMLAIVGISSFFILKQPDLGTALVILFSFFILLWIAGVRKLFFVSMAFIVVICAPVGWHFLKPYQKQRIIVFFGGGSSQKERYQIEQSRIAIGSGGLWGKGYLRGTQNQFNFLPESRTDFIFSVICEEWGFVGALCVIMLYVLLFARLFYVASTIKNMYMQLLALGLILPTLVSAIINICMVIGLLPIVGIPLPFITYGITHIWITFASLGWFNGIASRRFMYLNDGK